MSNWEVIERAYQRERRNQKDKESKIENESSKKLFIDLVVNDWQVDISTFLLTRQVRINDIVAVNKSYEGASISVDGVVTKIEVDFVDPCTFNLPLKISVHYYNDARRLLKVIKLVSYEGFVWSSRGIERATF